MLGYASAEEAVGMDILDAYVQESQMLSFKSRLTRQEKIVDEELQLRRRDGSTIWVSATAQLVRDENGRHAFVDGLLEDITQRKQIETEIRQAKERAEAANTAKSEFLARMSHEIRTPMNGVLGMLDLVIDSRMDSEQREYLTLARESAETLLEIVNDILDFSKIEAGKMQTENIEFGLRDCVEDTLAPLGLRAGARKLELLCDIDSRVPDSLVGDPKHLRQVLTNLVGNALKFTEKGEIVVVIDSRTLEGDLNELHVYVTDTGVGIDPVSQDRIFDAFEQAGGAKGKFGGTGLGLAITRQLVQLMGGTIRVQSELGKGSTFHFTAKFRTGHKPGRSGPIHTGLSLRGLPVLIVDDNFTNRRILTDVLLNWQMKPTAVDSAAAAMEVMNKAADAGQPYPLILLDACMPDTDGFALAGQITAESRFAGVKMIMLTSAGHLGDEEHCRKNGISGYLLKPIRQSVLLDLIMTTLGVETREEPKAASAPSTLVESGKSLPPLRILLAEDNPVNQRLAVKLLEKWRHSVSAVSDGLQVLSSLETQTYDVILMDVQMPGMDGIEATGAIRRKEASAGGHIPIIAMTAHALKGDRERCVKAGMDDYVSKPINPKELASAIERAIATAEAIRTENSSVPEMAAK
jgi:PAS domain S-box-containing protein